MTTERKNERDFGIFNVAKDQFYNLDYLSPFDDQEEFVDEPKTFTYEECERFVVHKKTTYDLAILNLMQPKFLLAFQLDVLRKQYAEKQLLENQKNDRQQEAALAKLQTSKNTIQKSKQSFHNDLHNWKIDINSVQTQISGRISEKLQNRPNFESYGLTSESFTSEEKFNLKKDFNILI